MKIHSKAAIHLQIIDCLVNNKINDAKKLLRQLQTFPNYKIGFSLMSVSLGYRRSEMVKHLLKVGCDVNVILNSDGFTPLMVAIKNLDFEIVEILLKNNADLFLKNVYGKNSLEQAIDYFFDVGFNSVTIRSTNTDRICILEIILQKFNNDLRINDNMTLQFLKCTNNWVKFSLIVLGGIELAKFVLKSDYDINYVEPKQNFTALHVTIIMGNLETTKFLIEHGAKVNVLSDNQHSALYYYLEKMERVDTQSEVLKLLIKPCWNIFSRSYLGHEVREVEELLRRGNKRTVRTIILESDADMTSTKFSRDQSLLHLLIKNEKFNAIDLLSELKIKFDVNAFSSDETILFKAVSCVCPKKVEFLLNHGAHVDFCELDSTMTPLFYACLAESSISGKSAVMIVELLLEYGADVQVMHDNLTIIDNIQRDVKLKEHYILDEEYEREHYATEVIVAHLAWLGTLDKLTNFTRNKIESYPTLKNYYDLRTQELEEMKKVVVYERVSLFKLYGGKENILVNYMRNPEFESGVSKTMKEMSHLKSYYWNSLQRRIAKAIGRSKLEQKAAIIIEKLTGLCRVAHRIIMYKIISFLDNQSLNNLWNAKNVFLVEK